MEITVFCYCVTLAVFSLLFFSFVQGFFLCFSYYCGFFPLSFISCIPFIRSKAAGLVTFKEERLHMSTNARGLGSLGTDGSLGHPLSSQSEGCLSATFCPSLTIPFSFGVSSIDSLT